jgi:ferric-dicitrate binding protein FerR (iron transport regulator)
MFPTLAVSLMAALLAAGPAGPPTTDVGRVSRLLPKVELQRGRTKLVLKENDTVAEADKIKTEPRGRARIVLHDGSILNLGSGSQMEVKAAPQGSQVGQMLLTYGRIRASVVAAATASRSPFEIRTKTAVCGVLGTDFFVDTRGGWTHVINISDPASGSRVRVANVNPRVRGEVTLNPGEGTVVRSGKPPDHPHVMGEPARLAAIAQTEAGN